jgi:hypothetical protein
MKQGPDHKPDPNPGWWILLAGTALILAASGSCIAGVKFSTQDAFGSIASWLTVASVGVGIVIIGAVVAYVRRRP